MRAAITVLALYVLAMPAMATLPDGASAAASQAPTHTADAPTHGASVDIRSKSRQPPSYPSEAIRAGLAGTVELQVDVAPDGAVGNIAIHRSSGSPTLDASAMEAARRWTYMPARLKGKPVAGSVRIPVTFEL